MKKHIFIIGLIHLLFASATAQSSFKLICDTAQTQINKGNYEKALQLYDKAFEVGSNDTSDVIWAATICSMCAIELQDEHKAINYNNIAIDFGSTDQLLIDQQLNLSEKHEDLETTEKVLLRMKEVPEVSEKYTIKLLYFYYNNKKYAETIATADRILEYSPKNVNAKYFKSVALLKTLQKESAIELLTSIVSEIPDHEKANRQLGLIYYNNASVIFDTANKNYKSLKAPTRLDYHNYREEIKKAESDYKKSLPFLEKSNSVDSNEHVSEAITLTKNRLRQLEQ